MIDLQALYKFCYGNAHLWVDKGLYLEDIKDVVCDDGVTRTCANFFVDPKGRSEDEIAQEIRAAKVAFVATAQSAGRPDLDVRFRYKIGKSHEEVYRHISKLYDEAVSFVFGGNNG